MKLSKAEVRGIVGGGFHTMLRKGIDGHGSGELWRYIHNLNPEDWRAMLDDWIVEPLMAAEKEKK